VVIGAGWDDRLTVAMGVVRKVRLRFRGSRVS
jgi:hypothetical protein